MNKKRSVYVTPLGGLVKGKQAERDLLERHLQEFEARGGQVEKLDGFDSRIGPELAPVCGRSKKREK